MSYLIMPLNQHSDNGFGAMADAYYNASEKLKDEKGLFIHLPQLYLLRHSIELYLKSHIILLNMKFKGAEVHTVIKSMSNEHNLKQLYTQFKSLFEENLEWLNQNTGASWSIPNKMDGQIEKISSFDFNSTVLRYPKTKDIQSDKKKDKIKKIEEGKAISLLESKVKKANITVLRKDDNTEEYYDFDTEIDPGLIKAFNEISSFLHGNHYGLRCTLYKGL